MAKTTVVPMFPEMGKARMVNGYVAYGERTIYEHRLAAEKKLGRPLREDEVIHHKNGIRCDNSDANLEILSPVEHQREHHMFLKPIACARCKEEFLPESSRRKYCSVRCSEISRRKVIRPSSSLLRSMIAKHGKVWVANKFGVSEAAVRKWAKQI